MNSFLKVFENIFPKCLIVKYRIQSFGVVGYVLCIVIRATLDTQTSTYDAENSKTHFVKYSPAND